MRILLIIMTGILAAAGLVLSTAHVLFGVIGFAEFAGGGTLGELGQESGYPLLDNTTRFLSGIFVATGVGFAYCITDLQNKLLLFRFLLLGIFIGGIARVIGWAELGVIDATIPATIIELVFPPVMLALQHHIGLKELPSA